MVSPHPRRPPQPGQPGLGKPRYFLRMGVGESGLVARIHHSTCRDLPAAGMTTMAELLPPNPNETNEQARARAILVKGIGSRPMYVGGKIPAEKSSNLQARVPVSEGNHVGSWIQVTLGGTMQVGILPKELADILAKAQRMHRDEVARLANAGKPVSKTSKPTKSATPAQVLGAILPVPTTLAVDLNRHQTDPHAGRRLEAARLMAGYSLRQFCRLAGIDHSQYRRCELGTEALEEERLDRMVQLLFPDAAVSVTPTVAVLDLFPPNHRHGSRHPPAGGTPQEKVLSARQELACQWLVTGGFAWWWETADLVHLRQSADELANRLNLPCWSGALLRSFTGWFHRQLTPEQRTLVSRRQVMPEIDVDGKVTLREFRLHRVVSVLEVREVSMKPRPARPKR